MMERLMPGCRFEGFAHLDEYARWFALMGAPATHARLSEESK
jgi:hypothetical protein